MRILHLLEGVNDGLKTYQYRRIAGVPCTTHLKIGEFIGFLGGFGVDVWGFGYLIVVHSGRCNFVTFWASFWGKQGCLAGRILMRAVILAVVWIGRERTPRFI